MVLYLQDMAKWHTRVVEEGIAVCAKWPKVALDSSIYLSAPGGPQWCVCSCAPQPTTPPCLLSRNSKLIVSVLQCGDIIPEATSVTELLPSRAEARSKPDFPVIVIEGLDATG